MMRVEQLMSKQVYWCRPEDTLDHAAQLMWEHDCGALPVCTGNGEARLIGMITDRDICMSALFQGRPLHEIRVSDTMSRELRVSRPEDATADAESAMRSAQVRRLPVVSESGELVGIISLADIAREAAREVASPRGAPEVTEMEVGDTLAAIVEASRTSAGSSSSASPSSASSL
jgi:CBS-domain-containing membrane protein